MVSQEVSRMRTPPRHAAARRRWALNEWHVLLALVLVAFVIWLTTRDAVRAADDWARQLLLSKATTLAAIVNPASVEVLVLSGETPAPDAYHEIMEVLARAKAADGTSRFVYLMGIDEHGVFFLVDSEPPDSPSHSPYGQRYDDPSEQLLSAFSSGTPFVEGPVTDDWGDRVSAHAPVVDPATGRVLALIGVDVSASLWLREARVDRTVLALPYIMVIVAAVMVLMRRNILLQLSYAATHDQLTGLLNRHEFAARVRFQLEKGGDARGALMLLDVDDLKYVNDVHSHAQGDLVLRQAASTIRATAGDAALVARQGGDEFAIAVPSCAWSDALKVAGEVVQAVGAACSQGQEYMVTASLGLADLNSQTSFESSLALADEALRAAKQAGKNRVYARSSAQGGAVSSRRQNTVRQVLAALKGHDFELWLQPVYRIAPKAVVFHEALLRLRRSSDEPVMPSEFLPAALEAGLMPQIDLWVVQQTLDILQRTRSDFRVSVNLSGITLADVESLRKIAKLVSLHRESAKRLLFEITGSNSLADLATTREWVEHMHKLGCGFAIDDFGEGYCSYRYLRELKVDYVKVDGRYVRGAIADSHSRAVIRSVREFAHASGSKVIAEHVETPEQIAVLRTEDIEYAQGFLLGMPEPTPVVLRGHLASAPEGTAAGRRA